MTDFTNLPKQTAFREGKEDYILADQDPGFCYYNPSNGVVKREWWIHYCPLNGWRVSMVEERDSEYMGGSETITRWVHLPADTESADGRWLGAKGFMRRFF